MLRYEENGTEIRVLEGAWSIPPNAFAGRTGITSVVLPDSVRVIGSGAFRNCTALEKISIPRQVERIQQGTFAGCSSLRELTVPCTVHAIAEGAFSSAKIEHLVMEEDPPLADIRISGYMGFSGAEICFLTVLSRSRWISEGTFRCSTVHFAALSEKNTNDINWWRVGQLTDDSSAAVLMPGVEPAEMQRTVRPQAARGFAYAYGQGWDLPEPARQGYLRWIRSHRAEIWRDRDFLRVLLGEKLIPAGEIPLFADDALKSGDTEILAAILNYRSRFSEEQLERAQEKRLDRILSGRPTVNELKKHWKWNQKKDGKLKISQYRGFDTEVTVPDAAGSLSVAYIGKYVFSPRKPDLSEEDRRRLNAVTSVVFPDTVEELSPRVFMGCENLRSVRMPDGPVLLRSEVFRDCPSLTSLELPAGRGKFPRYCCRDCTSLETAVLGSGFEEICEGAFYSCRNLRTAVLPDTLKAVGRFAFRYCIRLASLELPEGLQYMDVQAFEGSGLETLTLPGSAETEVPILQGLSCLKCLIFSEGTRTVTGCLNFPSLRVVNLPSTAENADLQFLRKKKGKLTVRMYRHTRVSISNCSWEPEWLD